MPVANQEHHRLYREITFETSEFSSMICIFTQNRFPRRHASPVRTFSPLLLLFYFVGLVQMALPVASDDLFTGGEAMLERVKKSVVSIYITPKGRSTVAHGFSENTSGTGSGTYINDQGYIYTAYHVVHTADKIYVRANDRSEKEAILVGHDPYIDFALLKLKDGSGSSNWLEIGKSQTLKSGSRVVAVGNPANLSTTFTAGIVSYLGRTGIGLWPVESYIQTDAQINPGNSGGALLDKDGRLIGINDAGHSRYPGLGFAIPIHLAEAATVAILSNRQRSYAWLGVFLREAGREFEEQAGFPSAKSEGLLIWSIASESPAESASLRFKDILTAADQQPLRSFDDLNNLLLSKQPGDSLTLQIYSEGAEKKSIVTLKPRPLMPRFRAAEFCRLFLNAEIAVSNHQVEENEDEANAPGFDFSVSRLFLGEKAKEARNLKEGMTILSFRPGHPHYAFFEKLQNPLQFEWLVNRCAVADGTSVAFSLAVKSEEDKPRNVLSWVSPSSRNGY